MTTTLTTKSFEVRTTNGAFYQIHHVGAVDEQAARALAKADADKACESEAVDAALSGVDAAGEYTVYRCTERPDLDLGDGEVTMIDAGAEG